MKKRNVVLTFEVRTDIPASKLKRSSFQRIFDLYFELDYDMFKIVYFKKEFQKE